MCKKLMQFIKHHIFSTHCPFKVFQGSNSDVKNVIRILNVYSALNGLALIK